MSVLLAPTTLALGVDDVEDAEPALAVTDATEAACEEHYFFQNSGSLAISSFGSFLLQGSAYNGCGGHGCDDGISGDFFSNGAWGHYVAVYEEGKWGDSCQVRCRYDGAYNHLDGVYHGRIVFSVENNRPVVAFGCGTSEDPGGWEFGGRLYLDSDCEESHGKPACS